LFLYLETKGGRRRGWRGDAVHNDNNNGLMKFSIMWMICWLRWKEKPWNLNSTDWHYTAAAAAIRLD
jgi:hypothetical protein